MRELFKEGRHYAIGLRFAIKVGRTGLLKDAIGFNAFDLVQQRICNAVETRNHVAQILVVHRFVVQAAGEEHREQRLEHGHHGALAR